MVERPLPDPAHWLWSSHELTSTEPRTEKTCLENHEAQTAQWCVRRILFAKRHQVDVETSTVARASSPMQTISILSRVKPANYAAAISSMTRMCSNALALAATADSRSEIAFKFSNAKLKTPLASSCTLSERHSSRMAWKCRRRLARTST